jgi:hypothetical protein
VYRRDRFVVIELPVLASPERMAPETDNAGLKIRTTKSPGSHPEPVSFYYVASRLPGAFQFEHRINTAA